MKFSSNISFFTTNRMNDQAQAKSFVNLKKQSVYESLYHTRYFTLRFCIPLLFFLIVLFTAGVGPVFSQSTIYVDFDAIGANDGSSWGDAYINLQDALQNAVSGDEIWVAEGIYYPDEGGGQTDNDREAVFQLISEVELYGGFAGDESTLNERDWQTHVTILSGDIDQETNLDGTENGVVIDTDNIIGNNSFTVIRGNNIDNSARLDGFTITGGKANGSGSAHRRNGGGFFNSSGSPTVVNTIIIGNIANNGGGMANHDNSTPVLTNVRFIGNETSNNHGGGMFNNNSHPILTDVIFYENFAANNGGGLYNRDGGSPILTNVLFSENVAATNAGAILNRDSSSPVLTNVTIVGNISEAGNIGGIYNGSSSEAILDNVIIWGNFSDDDTDILSASINTGNGANPTISHSLIANSGGGLGWNTNIGTDGGGNLDTDPIFANAGDPDGTDDIFGTPDDGLRLLYTSPAVNAGDNSAIPAGIITDLAGNDRIFDGDPDPDMVDMGAYELQEEPFSFSPDGNNVLYVDTDVDTEAAGYTGEGDSWENAIPELRDALSWAQDWDADLDGTLQIWVAEGVYYPIEGDGLPNDERLATFRLVSGVEIYGGFDPEVNADEFEDRDWAANLTILSGDIDANDGPFEPETNSDDHSDTPTQTDHIEGFNSYNVVIGSGTDGTALLDGFIITAGLNNRVLSWGGGIYINEGSPTLKNLIIRGNGAGYGGGIYNIGNSTLTNIIIAGNNAGTNGGGLLNGSSSSTLTNVILIGNRANHGGGMLNGNSSPTLTNVTIVGNRANNDGGGMQNNNSDPTLTNVIMWNNQADGSGMSTSASIFNFDSNSTPNISYSLIAHSGGSDSWDTAIGNDGGENLDTDPLFADAVDPDGSDDIFGTPDDGLTLLAASPAINTGDPDTDLSLFPLPLSGPDTPLDLAGSPRVFDGTPDPDVIDMGAYEFQVNPPGPNADNILFVDQNVSGGNQSGSSWDNAMPELRDALTWAGENWDGDADGTLEIWVADGLYTPTSTGERGATFQLLNDVEVYGGFAGGESTLGARDVETNLTILSGDIDGNDDPFEPEVDSDSNPDTPSQTDHIVDANSFHVVTGSSTDDTARLDGFTITAGQANENFPDDNGGGMFNDGGSPTLVNIIFSGNRADNGGGMINISNSSPALTDVTFSENSGDSGGGMFNVESSPTLIHVIFAGNSAINGGGMFNITSNPTLTNVTLSGNSSVTLSGDINSGNGGGMANLGSNPTLTNVTFSGNSATNSGGGMTNTSNSNPTLTNVIIWGNQAEGSSTTTSASIFNFNDVDRPTISHSLIANSGGSVAGWEDGIGTDGGNNIDANPVFVDEPDPNNAPSTVGNLHLTATSPAIDEGDNSAIPSGVTTDLAGNTRIFNSTVDMGAYEFQGDTQTDLDITLEDGEGWRMLSSPIAGMSYQTMLEPLWTQGVAGADFDGGTPNVYTWDLSSANTCQEGDPCPEWIVPPGGFENPIPAGSGFLMYVFSDDDFDGDPEGFDNKMISLSGPGHTGNISPTMNTHDEGWTLVGNPYGVPVAFGDLTTSNLTGVAYVYDSNAMGIDPPGPINGNGGAWRTTDVDLFGDLTGGFIATGQGFFVQNDGAGGSLTFTEASKADEGDGEFYGKDTGPRDFVRLEVQGESLYNSAWIRFSEKGSLEQTTGEALELQPLSTHYALLGVRKADGVLMDIAHYPLNEQNLEIPLVVETSQSGQFTITATDLDLPTGMALYLHDRQTGESMPIDDDSFEYSFSLADAQENRSNSKLEYASGSAQAPKGQASQSTVISGPSKAKTTGTDRFLITTTPGGPQSELPDEVALGQNYPNPFNPATVIRYQLPVNSEVRLEVYDMLGRNVATLVDGTVEAGTHQVAFDASNLSSGVYLYRLQTADAIFTKKLTLIK